MKITLLIKPDVKQFIVTPETEEEKAIFEMFPKEQLPCLVKRGSFYADCRGGWQREFKDDDSIMFVFAKEQGKEGESEIGGKK